MPGAISSVLTSPSAVTFGVTSISMLLVISVGVWSVLHMMISGRSPALAPTRVRVTVSL